MKRKRPNAKGKQKLAPVFNVDEVIQNVVRATANTHEWGLNDNDDVEERVEFQTAEESSKRLNQQASGQNVGVGSMLKNSTSPFVESDVIASTNFSRKTRSKLINTSRELSPLSRGADQVQDERSQQKEPMPPHQDLQYKDQDIKVALVVIKKVMKMDAAAPFILPVDPVALGILDYLDVIKMPMDFSTICNDLENGLKYQNSKDVFGDVQYIWENCIKYNRKGHYILKLMRRVKKKFMMLWTEAGLFTDQKLEINEYLHLPTTKFAETRSAYGHKSSLGVDCAKNSQQNQVEPSRHKSHLPSLSYAHSCQSQRRPYESPPSSPEPLARRNVDILEAARRWNACGHGCEVDTTDTISTHAQFQHHYHHHHQFSLGNCESHQPRKKPYSCHPTLDKSQVSHQLGGKSIATEEHSHIPPPRESTSRRMEVSQPQFHMHQPSVNHSQKYQTQKGSSQHIPSYGQQSVAEFNITSAGSCAHQQHDQPYCCHGHQHQPLVETHRDMLSSRKQPTSSAKSHADVEVGNAEEQFQPPPFLETLIRYTKRDPTKYPLSHLADHRRQDQKAASLQSNQPSLNRSQMERHGVKRSSSQVHANSDESHADVNMYSSDEFPSPTHEESMISSRKHKPTMDPDINSHLQREQIFSSQMQTKKGPSEGPPSYSQPQPSHPQAPQDMFSGGPNKVKKKTPGRGPTCCLDVWKNKIQLPVSTNEFWEPIGPEAPKFICFLGTIARNGHITPLNYIHWKAMPDENKERMWQLVESKFLIHPQSKDSILKSIATKWKNWKALLKAHHYNPHETDEERLANCNERVIPEQWRILVSFWNSTEAKKRSNTNKANRSKYTSNHACGSKSYARVREEQRMKRPGGKEPSQADLFIATRTRKNGQPVNEASSVIIAAQQQGTFQQDTIADDVFVQAVGEEKQKRTPGVGIILSKLRSSKPLSSEAVRMVYEAKAEVHQMRVKIVVVEQTCAQMAAQITTMMTMMQKRFSQKETPNGDVSKNSDRSVQFLSSSHGVQSLQRSSTKSDQY